MLKMAAQMFAAIDFTDKNYMCKMNSFEACH